MTSSDPIETLPVISVEISFTAPFATAAWEDITPYVQGFASTIGRQHELDQVQAGTLTLTLNNRDARFYPWNSDSPYASMGNGLVPQMPIKITAGWPLIGPTTYPIFYGYVDSWIPQWQDPVSADLQISATDIFGMLAVDALNFTHYRDQILALSPMGYWRLNDPEGSLTIQDYSGNSNTGSVVGAVKAYGEQGAITTDVDTAIDFGGTGFVNAPNTVIPTPSLGVTLETWVKLDSSGTPPPHFFLCGQWQDSITHLFTTINVGVGSANQWEVNVAGGYTFAFSPTFTPDQNWHHIVATIGPDFTFVNLYVDGMLADSQTAAGFTQNPPINAKTYIGGDLASGFDGQLDEVAIYPYVLTGTQVAANFTAGRVASVVTNSGTLINELCTQAGIPSGLLNIATGIANVQPLTTTASTSRVLDVMQTVATTEGGLLYQRPDGVLRFLNRHYPTTNPASVTSQATFEDSGAPTVQPYVVDNFVPGLDNLDLWNEAVVSALANAALGVSGGAQLAEDLVSQAKYGKRSYPTQSSLLFTSDQEALAFAQWLVNRYSEPKQRVRSIQSDSTINNGNNLPQMLGRALWDRITVVYNGLHGGTPFTQDALIEGITHTFAADPGSWTTQFKLSPAQSTAVFTLDDPVLGLLDSGNVLGF